MYSTFNLDRFVTVQEQQYSDALSEIRNGRKVSHWIWFVFPQLDGLGFSNTSKQYAIKSRAEAMAYLHHSVLGMRLREITEALLLLDGKSVSEIMGSPDDLKLKSSMTLFAMISEDNSIFEQVLNKYFGGELDERTVDLLD